MDSGLLWDDFVFGGRSFEGRCDYLVLETVVENEHLAVGPGLGDVADAQLGDAAVGHLQAEVGAQPAVGRSRVRSHVRSSLHHGELDLVVQPNVN